MSSELTHNPGQFDKVIHIIDNARSRAMKAVNAELIQMYWSVGAYLSELCSASSFGDKIIDEVAAYIAQENPNIKGFNRRGLYRMKQFYETYKDDEFVTPRRQMNGIFTWRSVRRNIIPNVSWSVRSAHRTMSVQ